MATINKTKIPWATDTWPVIVGCRRGCTVDSCGYDCFAKRNFPRYRDRYPEMNGKFENISFIKKNFDKSFPKKPGARILLAPSTDPEYWKGEYIEMILDRIRLHQEHSFLMLTKNPLIYYREEFINAPENLWLGATANNANELTTYQDALCAFQNNITFISMEPIREEIPLGCFDPDAIDWLIIGGQSGPGERFYPRLEYMRGISEFCHSNKVPLFIKGNLEVFDKKQSRGNQVYKLCWPGFQQYPEVKCGV